jgi:hypothetical protein
MPWVRSRRMSCVTTTGTHFNDVALADVGQCESIGAQMLRTLPILLTFWSNILGNGAACAHILII